MKRILDIFHLILFIFLLCISCGIDEIPVLSKPQYGSINTIDKYFEFDVTKDNSEEEFRGFEVYYKFFSTNSDPGTQSNYTSAKELEISGFKRITYYIDENDCDKASPSRMNKPLIKVNLPTPTPEPGDDDKIVATVTINFGTSVGKGPQYSVSADVEDFISIPTPEFTPEPSPTPEPGETHRPTTIPGLPIRRGIEDDQNPGYFKSFEIYKKTDPDVGGLDSLDEGKVYILIYVLSYGVYNFSEPIYSDALCLGYLELRDLYVEE